jgi:peptidoglycan/LPS O-acetylase OafA/YrhL
MKLPKFIPQFDHLRAFAVLLVMLFHASHHVKAFPMSDWFSFGWVGVDLFFVLSGFLITRILLETRRNPNYFLNFYARRVLRIWPLYFALLALMFLVMPRIAPHWSAEAMKHAHPGWAFILFVQNLTSGHDLTGPLSVTWSLAIEEQFYLVWPFIVWLLPERWIWRFALLMVVLSPAVRIIFAAASPSASMYFNTLTRLDGLALGSLLASWLPQAEPTQLKRVALAVLPVAFAVAIFYPAKWIQFSAIAFVAGAVVCLSLFLPLRNRFLTYTGRISYGLYLVHSALFGLATKTELRRFYPSNPLLNDIAYLLVGTALAYSVATLSWFAFEKPILRAKAFFGDKPQRKRSHSFVPSQIGSLEAAAAEIAD